MLFLLTAILSATLCAAQSAHSIDASAAPGDVMVPTGAFTTLTITTISGKRVTVPAGVTADSLDFSGGISNGVLEIQGGTFGAVTVGAMTGGSVAFSCTVNGNVTFSTLTGIKGFDIGGFTVTDGAVTFGAINGSAAKPNVSLAGITVTNTAGTKGVYFSSTVYSLGGLSFKNANISITGTANVYALRFADVVEDVDELVLDGATLTSTSSGSTAGSVYGYSAMRIGRVSATGAVLTAVASASAYALYLAGNLSDTFVLVHNSTIAATSTVKDTAYAAVFGTMSGESSGIEFHGTNVSAAVKASDARALFSAGLTNGQVSITHCHIDATAGRSSAFAGHFGSMARVPSFTWAASATTAAAKAGSAYAVYVTSLTDVGDVVFQGQRTRAVSDDGGDVYAVVFGAVTRVATMTVRHVVTEVKCAQGRKAHALVVAGATDNVGALLYKNVTGTALAGTDAQAVGFNGAVSKLGSLVIEDVDLDTRTVSTEPYQGYGARSIVFLKTVEAVTTLVVRNTKLRADAIQSYNENGARSLWFLGAVRHVTTLLIEDVNATASCARRHASALHFNGAVSKVSSLRVSRASVTSTASTYGYAVTFSDRLTTVGELVVADTVVVVTASSAHAVYTGALVNVLRAQFVNIRIVMRGGRGHALHLTSVADAEAVLVEHVRVVMTGFSYAGANYAVTFGTVTRVAAFTVRHTAARAKSASDVLSLTGAVTEVGTLLFQNVTGTVQALVNAYVMSFRSGVSKIGSLVIEDVDLDTRTVGTEPYQGYGARSIVFAAVEVVGNLVVRNAKLRSNAIKSLTFSGKIYGAQSLCFGGTVRHVSSLLIEDVNATTTCVEKAASAVHFNGAVTNVSSLQVSRTVVTATTGDSDAYAVVFAALERVVTFTIRQVVIRAECVDGSNAKALVVVGAVTEVRSLLYKNLTVSARCTASSPALAASLPGKLSHSGQVVLQDVTATATAYAKTSRASVMELGQWDNVTSLLIQGSTLRAMVRGGVTRGDVRALCSNSIFRMAKLNVTDSTVTADSAATGPTSVWALNLVSLRNVGVVVVIRSTVDARSTGPDRRSSIYAVCFGPVRQVTAIKLVDTPVTATAKYGATYAVCVEALDTVVNVIIEGQPVRAVSSDGASVMVFGEDLWSRLTRVTALAVRHVVVHAECSSGRASTLVVLGPMSEVSTLMFSNVTVTVSGPGAQIMCFNAAVSKIGSLVIEGVTLDSSPQLHRDHLAQVIVFLKTVEEITTFVVRNANLQAADLLGFVGAVRHVTTLLVEDVNATATGLPTSASALHFRGDMTNVRGVVARRLSIRATALTYANALVISNFDEGEFERIDIFVSATRAAGVGTCSSFTGSPTRLILKEVSLRVIASQASVIVFSSTLISTTLLIQDCVFNVSSPSLVLPTFSAVTDSDIRIEGTKFDFSSTSNSSVDTFLLIRSLVRSFLSVRRCDFYAPATHTAQFVSITDAVSNSVQHYSGTFAAAAFGTGPAPFNITAPLGLCELCFNGVEFASVTKSYDPSRLEALGYTIMNSSRCRATDTAEISKTGSVRPSASATGSASPVHKTGSVTAPGTRSVSESPRVSATAATPTASAVRTFTASGTRSSIVTLPRSRSLSSLASLSSSSGLSKTFIQSVSQGTNTPTLSESFASATSSTSFPKTATLRTLPAPVLKTATAAATLTADPTATARPAVAPRAVPRVLARARNVATVTSSLSAIVSPTSALAQQRAGALTSKTCPEDPPNGEDPLSFLDNPMQQSMGNGPAKYHVGAVAGNLLILTGGAILCAVAAVSVTFVSHVFPKHHEREAARLAGRGAYVLCVFLQCFGGEVIMIAALLVVTPSCAAAVVCVGHPSSDVTAFERALGAVTLVIVLFAATALSVLTARARRYCYCPEEDRSRQAAGAVAGDRVKGAPPAPWESTSTASDVASCANSQQHSNGMKPVARDSDNDDDDDDDDDENITSANSSNNSGGVTASKTAGGDAEGQRKAKRRTLAAARRIAQVVVLGPEWEARPELRPLLAGAAEAILLLIGDSRPAITRPELCFLDRHGCHWFFALDLWVAVLTGVGVGVLELSHCGVAPAVAVLQFLYVFLFIITRPLRSPLLLGVSFIALVLQSAAVILAAVTSSGLFSKPQDNSGDTTDGGEDEDGTADLLDLVSTMLALVLAVQGIIALGVGAATRYFRKQRADKRAAATTHQCQTQDVMMGDVNGDAASVPLLERLLPPDQFAPGSPTSASVTVPATTCSSARPPAAAPVDAAAKNDDMIRDLLLLPGDDSVNVRARTREKHTDSMRTDSLLVSARSVGEAHTPTKSTNGTPDPLDIRLHLDSGTDAKTDWAAVFGTSRHGSNAEDDDRQVLHELLRQHGRPTLPTAQHSTTGPPRKTSSDENKEPTTLLDDFLTSSSGSDGNGRARRTRGRNARHSTLLNLSPARRLSSDPPAAAPPTVSVNPLVSQGLQRAPMDAVDAMHSNTQVAAESENDDQRAISTSQVPLENWKHAVDDDDDDFV